MKKIISIEQTEAGAVWTFEDGTKELVPYVVAKEDDTSWDY